MKIFPSPKSIDKIIINKRIPCNDDLGERNLIWLEDLGESIDYTHWPHSIYYHTGTHWIRYNPEKKFKKLKDIPKMEKPD